MRAVPRAVQDSQYRKPNSLTAAQRIPRSEGYSHSLQSESVADKYFKLFFVRNQLKKARLGIVAAKRHMPKAVDRNRAKREIREAFRRHNITKSGLDLVVMVRRNAQLDHASHTDSLSKLFSRVETRCAES